MNKLPAKTMLRALMLLTAVAGDRQFRTLREAAQAVAPGDTVLIHTEFYRESVTVGTSGTAARPIRFEAAPAANVVVTGADRLTGRRKEPGPDQVTASWGTCRGSHWASCRPRASRSPLVDAAPLLRVYSRGVGTSV